VPDVRVAALRSDKSPKKRMAEVMPDIKILMPSIKEEVLAGTVVVFSGIMPLGHDVLK
jgi:RNA polymerase II subunit A-like phosphatase